MLQEAQLIFQLTTHIKTLIIPTNEELMIAIDTKRF